MTNNTKSLSLAERIVEYQEQVFHKPTQDYDSLSGCGNEGDLFWGGYALGEYDTHIDNKPLVYALIEDRARLLAEVEKYKELILSCKPKSLGVATFGTGKCWCLKDDLGEIVGACEQCPIHGSELKSNKGE